MSYIETIDVWQRRDGRDILKNINKQLFFFKESSLDIFADKFVR